MISAAGIFSLKRHYTLSATVADCYYFAPCVFLFAMINSSHIFITRYVTSSGLAAWCAAGYAGGWRCDGHLTWRFILDNFSPMAGTSSLAKPERLLARTYDLLHGVDLVSTCCAASRSKPKLGDLPAQGKLKGMSTTNPIPSHMFILSSKSIYVKIHRVVKKVELIAGNEHTA